MRAASSVGPQESELQKFEANARRTLDETKKAVEEKTALSAEQREAERRLAEAKERARRMKEEVEAESEAKQREFRLAVKEEQQLREEVEEQRGKNTAKRAEVDALQTR